MLRLFNLSVRLREDGFDYRFHCVRFRDQFFIKYCDVRIYGGCGSPYNYGKNFPFCSLSELVKGKVPKLTKKENDMKLISAMSAVEFLRFDPDKAKILEDVLIKKLPIVRETHTTVNVPTLFVGGYSQGEILNTVSQILDSFNEIIFGYEIDFTANVPTTMPIQPMAIQPMAIQPMAIQPMAIQENSTSSENRTNFKSFEDFWPMSFRMEFGNGKCLEYTRKVKVEKY